MPRWAVTAVVVAATAMATLLLDGAWLGLVANGLYAAALGTLGRKSVFLPAAAAFYALYVVFIVRYAVDGASGVAVAARKGAALGLVVYASYELTNWAVLRGWPASLVPLDIAWGVVLTASAAAVGKAVHGQLSPRVQG